MEPIKLGIIGCGIAARDLHLPALQLLSDKFVITAVCNHTVEKARSFAELAGNVPYHLDYRELLERDDVEAVDILLPIELNLQVTSDALTAGKHVLVEKPLAVNLKEAEQMLELDKKHSEVKMVAENFRYRPGLIRMKQLIQEGKIGQPYAVFWNIFHLMNMSNKYAKTRWRIEHKYPGGFITDGGVHNIAGLRLLFGDIVSGNAFVRCQNPHIGEMDTFSFQFETEQNVNGVLNIFISTHGYSENRILIMGDTATMSFQDGILSVEGENGSLHEEFFEDDRGYYEQFIDFHQGIRENKPVISNFEEAYKDLETIILAQQNALGK